MGAEANKPLRRLIENGAEAAVVATLLYGDEEPGPYTQRMLDWAPSSFQDEQAAKVAVAIQKLQTSGQDVSLATVAREMGVSQFELAALEPNATTTTLCEMDAQEAYERFRNCRCSGLVERWLHSDDRNITRLISLLEEITDTAALDGGSGVRPYDQDNPPPAEEPRFWVGGVPVSTPGNLTVIVAQRKAGKSAFTAAMMASVMARGDGDFLGVKAAGNFDGKAVVHFDTEQSAADHHNLIERTRRRAGLARTPSWLHSYCLTGVGPIKALAYIRSAIRRCGKLHRGVYAVVIDGVADLVADVNDPVASNDLTAQLMSIAAKHECPIISCLHLNPVSPNGNPTKGRGHLGSQLERKAETVLVLENHEDTITVRSTATRKAPVTDAIGPCFRWSESAGMHVSCERLPSEKHLKLMDDAVPVLEAFSERPGMPYGDLKSTITDVLNVGPATAERRIRSYIKAGLVVKGPAGIYTRGRCTDLPSHHQATSNAPS
jgi:hypothetical protein